ncbi:MAG: flagellar motor switch protein FliG [Clostridia bacterium]|nr:flagellar motor switch protein FliG [Clostridia bacterium]NLF35675.1 flagellar motor switch protein FliG [Clostridiaceae bacterium]MDD3093022.1 flagellar motor switch protein FliG [Clostridia bacterium]MDD3970835.1 flagellar motor switch protein FliG [Clostridia bacterium]MDD4542543.1 flagellar motor switch protein FliG [Clostridia bacterium]
MNSTYKISGKEKAAYLLIMLGKGQASKIMKYFNEDEIKTITFEIVNHNTIDKEERMMILQDFYNSCLAKSYIDKGGVDYAREVLYEAVGPQKAMELITDMMDLEKSKPFDFMKDIDPVEVFNFIQYENDQTIAFILSYLKNSQAASVLAMLPRERQANISVKIALMDKISPDIIKDIEKVMGEKFTRSGIQTYTKTEGVEVLVNILNAVDRSTEKQIFEMLEEENDNLANEVKKRMFVFEDIINLGNKEIQRFLSEVDTKDLSVALKTATEELKELILRNLSKRAKQMVTEEMNLLGPVRLSEVEKAQQALVSVIRALDEKGEILIRKTGDDKIID